MSAASDHPVRGIVIDDSPVTRKAVMHASNGDSRAGEGGDGVRALQLVRLLEPDVLVLDLESTWRMTG